MSAQYLDMAKAAAIIAAPLIGGGVSSYLTYEWPRSIWYKQLKKPWFTPPNWVFAPVWTTLYGCMGYSSYLVWRDAAQQGVDARLPLAVYSSGLILNWLWSPVFFNRKDYGQSTAIIAVMWGSAATCVHLFRSINVTASNLLVPYLGWLSLATSLTVYIWMNNPPPEPRLRRSLLGYPLDDKQN